MAIAPSYTPLDTAVIREARRRRRSVLVLREDREWLQTFSTDPKGLLKRMSRRGALQSIDRGRYAIVERVGAASAEEAAPWQVLADGLLSPYGSYYLGYLTAIVEHSLTDLESPTIYAALQGDAPDGQLQVIQRPLVVTSLVESKWFGVEPVRLSRTERYYRSDLERTMVDCLDRPQLCGSPEVYVTAWSRGLSEGRVDIAKLCRYALDLSASVAQRAGLLLSLAGREDEAREHLAAVLGRKSYPDFDSRTTFKGTDRDPTWRVVMTIPREVLEGWMLGWKNVGRPG
jgi:predicted transcriptional regulator of viral defense system